MDYPESGPQRVGGAWLGLRNPRGCQPRIDSLQPLLVEEYPLGFALLKQATFAIIAFTVILLSLVICVPFLRELFRFGPLHPNDVALSFAAGILCILWFEAVKLLSLRKPPAQTASAS